MKNHISGLTASMFTFVLFLASVIQSSTCAEPLAKITVEAGKHTRIDTPVAVVLDGIPECLPDAALRLEEIRGSEHLPVPTQIEPGSPRRLWWILHGTTPAGGKRIYELVSGSAVKGVEHPPECRLVVPLQDVEVSVIEVVKNDSFLQIQAGDNKVLRYNHALVSPPEGISPLYTRSGFIHPLWSPTGAIVTDIHPSDHIHHMGIWMPWTKTKFEEREVDFWNLKKGKGTVHFVKFLSTTSGPVFGGFRTEHEHIDLSAPQGEKVALKEIWNVRVYNLGGPKKGYWLWDFVSTQRCATDSPLHQLQHRYGGLGFRGGEQWFGENISFLTSEGKTRKDGHGTRACWCDISGLSGKDWAGVTIMSHPENYRHPEPMRIHPRIPFFNFAPSQLGNWTMKPGQDYVFRYRFYVHEGKVSIASTERFWNDFAEPPEVKLDVKSETGSEDEKWQALFNSKDLKGWIQRGGKARYHVKDGTIVGTTVQHIPSSFLCTEKTYANFILELEFKVDPDLNSGVQIRSNSRSDYKNGRVHGYQVEIDPSERAWSGGIYDEARRGWLYDLRDNEPASKAFKNNEWNHFRIEAIGNSIKTWINGVPAANLVDSMTPEGFIALQVHKTKSKKPLRVQWRNIRIQDLGRD